MLMTGKKKVMQAIVDHMNKKVEDPEKKITIKDVRMANSFTTGKDCWSAIFVCDKYPRLIFWGYYFYKAKDGGFTVYNKWSKDIRVD